MCATRFFLPPSASRYRANAPTSTDLGADANLRLIPFPSSSRHGLSSISYIPSSTTSRVLSTASLSPFVVASRSAARLAKARDSSYPNQSFSARTALALSSSSYVPSAPSYVSRTSASASASRRNAPGAPRGGYARPQTPHRASTSRVFAHVSHVLCAHVRGTTARERVPQHAAHRVRSRAAVETPAGARMRRDSECGAHFV